MAEGLYSNGTHLELLKNNALLSAENSIQGKLNDQDVFRLSEKEQNAIQILYPNLLKLTSADPAFNFNSDNIRVGAGIKNFVSAFQRLSDSPVMKDQAVSNLVTQLSVNLFNIQTA